MLSQSLGSVENTICEILDTIATGISGVAEDQNAFNEKTENNTLELAMCICRKLFPALSEEGKLCEVSAMTKSMISRILVQPKITIFANADVVVALREKIDPFLAERGYEGIATISEDSSLPVSGCRIQWQGGQAVRNPEAGLQDIEQIVSEFLTNRTQLANMSQKPNSVTESDVGPMAELVLESEIDENFDAPKVG